MEENGRLVRFIFHKGEAVAEQEENSNVIRLIRGSELIARSSDSESARTYYHYACLLYTSIRVGILYGTDIGGHAHS